MNEPTLSLIVALSKNNVIGVNNGLPWKLPDDLKRFRRLTTGHHIIMGRKTYESIGRLLPGRTTVIISRSADFKVEGAIVAHNLEDAISACGCDSELFLIGGEEMYKAGLQFANKMYITDIDANYEGDAFFPKFDTSEWNVTNVERYRSQTGLEFSYVTYERNK